MAPAADFSKSYFFDNRATASNPIKRAWKEDRIDIPPILLGRGQENASTARFDLEEGLRSKRSVPQPNRDKTRQNGARQRKASKEALRQGQTRVVPTNDSKEPSIVVRAGRQYSVAGVGNNGKIYLRPSSKVQGSQPPLAFEADADKHTKDADLESLTDKKRWSDSQASRMSGHPQRARSVERPRRSNSISGASIGRSSSFSNADRNADPGLYRVAINNDIAQNQGMDENALTSLEVPIPHYRLGTPRFGDRGTAVLSTLSTHDSRTDQLGLSLPTNQSVESLISLPPGIDSSAVMAGISMDQIQPQQSRQAVPIRMPVTTIAPVFHRAREPIIPSIYDPISLSPDHPSIVRYAMSSSRNTREISAASPARLIAQITSKNFLDYDLLSDFFLTVRAYLSTNDLLEYLLARFEWAVNRYDDEGRVIRVRAFAAIRHWILNYFPYDFVVDRPLRVKFCDRLNYLSKHVRTQGMEASNLKLIMDLKKCWNGRCNLYWDTMVGELETRFDQDIAPGGIVGSRDSRLTHPNDLWAELASSTSHQVDEAKSVAALHNWVDSVIEAEGDGNAKTERQPSIAISSHPGSQTTDQTVQATSCAMPGKSSLNSQSNRNTAAPRPAQNLPPQPTRAARPSAASHQPKERMNKSKSQHQRTGSISDALHNKRASLGAIQEGKVSEQPVMSMPFSGSLVRGSVFPPGSPFIDKFTPQGSGSSLPAKRQYATMPPNDKMAPRPLSPGVRNLLANIRRAWSSKQQQNASVADPAMLPPAPFMVETKQAALPMHVAYKIENYGDPNHQLEALKKNARVDLLCADITEMFEQALSQQDDILDPGLSSTAIDKSEENRDTTDSWKTTPTTPRDPMERFNSEVTNGSRSIVIMDDTKDSQPPVPAIPPHYSKSPLSNQLSAGPYSVPSSPHEPPVPSLPKMPSSAAAVPTDSDSLALRKYASFQGGVKSEAPAATDGRTSVVAAAAATAANIGSIAAITEIDQQPGRTLRRKPGGDLRANQNVHDLEQRPRSTGSIRTFAESVHDLTIDSGRAGDGTPTQRRSKAKAAGPAPVPAPKKKDLRRSFELAVAQFARIPDHDGGDLEATLAKLEGKFRKSPNPASPAAPLSSSSSSSRGKKPQPLNVTAATAATGKAPVTATDTQDATRNSTHSIHSVTTPTASSFAKANGSQEQQQQHSSEGRGSSVLPSTYTGSEDSYNSMPVVNRDAKQKSLDSQAVSDTSADADAASANKSGDSGAYNNGGEELEDGEDYIGGESIHERRGRYRSSIPTMTTDSFLLDEDEFLSDLSSELSDEDDEFDDSDEDFSLNDMPESLLGEDTNVRPEHLERPTAPEPTDVTSSRYTTGSGGRPPSPPMTSENAKALLSEASRQQEQRKPPTPEPSPDTRLEMPALKSRSPSQVDESVMQPFANKPHRIPPRRHIPFILAFDPVVLAEQFTIIERDALNEINWQDLIELRWQRTAPVALNWVEYLRCHDPNGVDLVTARFNVVIKWTLSEIVLTHNLEERALTIMKFIRIAQHARKIHNYATLLQITIALTSADCTRLKKTWARVADPERRAMKDMEFLVSPVRNFYNLRAEMEAADLDHGCIPVVALFLHDLTYNAQKPSIIASTRDAEPLVNFERYRTTAIIVKTLLRHIDASAKYNLKPVEGALERCLWMASLSDAGIQARSHQIEP